ncbi:hypothetical protein VNO77_16358 [Canavalia gladiata]|uniref:Uncharacterized protein n=1 Tax=Canavalia gladiata TaxID=3824 RepID=A0AAN9M0X0_CANGL
MEILVFELLKIFNFEYSKCNGTSMAIQKEFTDIITMSADFRVFIILDVFWMHDYEGTNIYSKELFGFIHIKCLVVPEL